MPLCQLSNLSFKTPSSTNDKYAVGASAIKQIQSREQEIKFTANETLEDELK